MRFNQSTNAQIGDDDEPGAAAAAPAKETEKKQERSRGGAAGQAKLSSRGGPPRGGRPSAGSDGTLHSLVDVRFVYERPEYGKIESNWILRT
jgi:hypothetical protein